MDNSVDMANNLIKRAMNLQLYTVETDVPSSFRFNGEIPFDMTINDGWLTAKVYALDFREATEILNDWLIQNTDL